MLHACMHAQAEREARIAAEAAAAGPSARAMEEEALGQLLAPLGLRMREIKVSAMLARLPVLKHVCMRAGMHACRYPWELESGGRSPSAQAHLLEV